MNSAFCCVCGSNTDLKYISNGDGDLLEKLELCGTSDLNGTYPKHICNICKIVKNEIYEKEPVCKSMVICDEFIKEDELCDDIKIEETQLIPSTRDYQEYEPSTVTEQHAEPVDGVQDKSQLHKCDYCDRTYHERDSLWRHIKKEHAEYVNTYKCTYCYRSYIHESKLIQHLRERHRKLEPCACHICGQTFSQADLLENHMKSHEYIEYSTAFMCNMCGEMFKGQNSLDYHMKKHMSIKNRLKIFNRKSINEYDAKTQYKKSMSDISKNNWRQEFSTSFICDVCEEMFISQFYLDNHMEYIHSMKVKNTEKEVDKKKGPFRCEHCGKISKHSSTHINHLRKHTNERPYKCNRCNKQFFSRNDVERHVEVHSDGRPFQCKVCLKGFSTFDYLKRHGLRHEKTYKYHCEVCNKGFSDKQKLVQHGKIHSGNHSYKCATCEEIFETLMMIKRHAVKIHGSPIFSAGDETHSSQFLSDCATCKKSYSSAITLKRHAIEVHSILNISTDNADDEQEDHNKAKPNEDEAMSEEKVVAQLEKTKSGALNDEDNIAKEIDAAEEFISIKEEDEEFLEDHIPQNNGNEIKQNDIQIISRKIVKII